MNRPDSVEIVENFWRDVWQTPQDPTAVHRYVSEDFVITSGGQDIVGPEPFEAWIRSFLGAVENFEFHIVESFSNGDGSRVASRWRITGRNRGLMQTEPNGVPFEMTGTAVWQIRADGKLEHNWVERNAFEVHGVISGHPISF